VIRLQEIFHLVDQPFSISTPIAPNTVASALERATHTAPLEHQKPRPPYLSAHESTAQQQIDYDRGLGSLSRQETLATEGRLQVYETTELIRQLARERFYGALTLKFEAGRIVLVKKEETLKPTNLSEKPRSQHEEESV
jgi:hypothetical protein